MNHIKDNHEQEEDRKAKWRDENRDALLEIECLEDDIGVYEDGIEVNRLRIKEIKKQIGWQE